MFTWLKRLFHVPTPEEQYAKGGWLVRNTLQQINNAGSYEELVAASKLFAMADGAFNDTAADRAFDRGVIEGLMVHGYHEDHTYRFGYFWQSDKRLSMEPVKLHPSLMRYSDRDSMRNNHERRTR
jgi:hypothetical protein